MAFEARTVDLLQRFPDQLSDEEEAELRALAESDPKVAALVEELSGLEAAMQRPAPPQDPDLGGELALSELGRRRLERELRGLLDRGDLGQQKASPTPTRGPPWVWAVVAAAVLLLGLGALLRPAPAPPPDDLGALTLRGDADAVDVDLVVLGDDGPLVSGGARPATSAVRFQAVASGPTWLALLETQGGKTMMVYPVRGAQWESEGGVELLQPPGSAAEYTPATTGQATYHLIAAPGPIQVPAGPTSADDLSALHESAEVAAQWAVEWTR